MTEEETEFIEHPINSIVEISGKQHKVIPANSTGEHICIYCALYNENIVKRCKKCANYRCSRFDRSDQTDILYRLVEEIK